MALLLIYDDDDSDIAAEIALLTTAAVEGRVETGELGRRLTAPDRMKAVVLCPGLTPVLR